MLKFLAILWIIWKIVDGQNLISPCPGIFEYLPTNETDRWFGRITLTTDIKLYDGIWIVMIFSDPPVEVKSAFAQKNLRLKDTEFLFRTYGVTLEPEKNLTVDFSVKYSKKTPIPEIKMLRLNTRPICPVPNLKTTTALPVLLQNSAPATTEEIFVTSEELPVTEAMDRNSVNGILDVLLGSDGMEFLFNTNLNHSYYPGDIAFAPNPGKPTLLSTFIENQNVKCGTIIKNAKNANNISALWPWHAILFNFIGPQIMYSCGGSLISDFHVLTAAHCVAKPRTKIPISVDILSVFLGKQTLKSFGTEVVVKEVAQIIIHPEYNFNVLYNDIAIIKLATRVHFTDFIRPICLWSSVKQLVNVERTGIAIGYGFDMMKQVSVELRGVPMTILKQEECWKKNSLYPRVLFEKNFCGGFISDNMNCNGDSGGGLVTAVYNGPQADPIWHLRGLISIGVALQGQFVCNSSQNVVFTDVTKHVDWIKLNLK